MTPKTLLIASVLLTGLVAVMIACKKSGKMTVVIDCSGTYLQKNGKDYQVCNLDRLEGFEDGDEVTAKFIRKSECNDPSQPDYLCERFHNNEGWVEVTAIE